MLGKSVLIVEDEAIVAMDIEERLRNMGFKITGVAASAKKAIELVENIKPDLILMDIQIQGNLDGIQTAERIIQDHDLPVIFLTANSDPATLDRVKRFGSFGYLLKPFEEQDLSMAIDVAIYRHRVERELKISKEWFITTLRCIGEGVIATDDKHRIKFMNPAAELLTGIKGIDFIGQSMESTFRLVDSGNQCILSDMLEQTENEGNVIEIHDSNLSTNATNNSVSISGSVTRIGEKNGMSLGVIMVFRLKSNQVENPFCQESASL